MPRAAAALLLLALRGALAGCTCKGAAPSTACTNACDVLTSSGAASCNAVGTCEWSGSGGGGSCSGTASACAATCPTMSGTTEAMCTTVCGCAWSGSTCACSGSGSPPSTPSGPAGVACTASQTLTIGACTAAASTAAACNSATPVDLGAAPPTSTTTCAWCSVGGTGACFSNAVSCVFQGATFNNGCPTQGSGAAGARLPLVTLALAAVTAAAAVAQ